MHLDAPPIRDPATRTRMEHQRLRWRLLYGMAEDDIRARIKQSIGHVRKELWGPIDLTSNPYLQVWTQSAALYTGREPIVTAPEGGEEVAEAVAESGYWCMMQRVQRDALALREMLVRIDWDEQDGPLLQPVPPFLVEPVVSARHPSRALAIREWIQDPDKPGEWVRRIYDPRISAYWAEDADGNDVSLRVLGGSFVGDRYPWHTPDGPILPWVCYRAEETGWFFDTFTGREVVEGTLQLGMLMTFYSHIIRASSWRQRWGVNAKPAGGEPGQDGETREHVTDPSSFLAMQLIDPEQRGELGEFSQPIDPEAVLRSIMAYERRLVDMALGSAQVSRASSDIRSGYSLAVSKEQQRELQRSFTPLFRRRDQELLAKVAGLMARPTRGWRVDYDSIPRSAAEIQADLDRLAKAVELGLMDLPTAYQEQHPGLSRVDAEQEVARIQEINQRLRQAA